MAESGTSSVLKRKALQGRQSGPEGRRPAPSKALRGAFVRALEEQIGLVATVRDCVAYGWTLAELLEGLPEDGLLGVLEGPAESQGLMALDAGFLVTLIERQMTGRLASEPPPARRPTRTDAALSADVIDAILRAFEAEFVGRPESQWASGFGYSSYLDDPRPLGMLLEEIDYRVFVMTLDFDNGNRTVKAVLALPAEGRGPIVHDPDLPEEARPPATMGDWTTALAAVVEDGSVPIEGVLWRFRMPIADVTAFEVGQDIEIPTEALDGAALVSVDGKPFAYGRLGQYNGFRAVRLPEGDEGATATPAAALPANAAAPDLAAAAPDAAVAAPMDQAFDLSSPIEAAPELGDLSDLPDLADFDTDTLPALT